MEPCALPCGRPPSDRHMAPQACDLACLLGCTKPYTQGVDRLHVTESVCVPLGQVPESFMPGSRRECQHRLMPALKHRGIAAVDKRSKLEHAITLPAVDSYCSDCLQVL